MPNREQLKEWPGVVAAMGNGSGISEQRSLSKFEEKEENQEWQGGNGQRHLKPWFLKAHGTSRVRNEAKIQRSKEACSTGPTLRARDLGNHPPIQTLILLQEETGGRSKKRVLSLKLDKCAHP